MAGEKEKEAKNAAEANSEPAKNAAEANSEPASSKKGTAKSLKPKAKIVKKKSLHTNVAKINKFEGTSQVQGNKSKKKRKKKRVSDGNMERSNSERASVLNSSEKKQNSSGMKQESIAHKEHNDRSQQNIKTKEKLSGFRKKQKNQKGGGLENPKNQMSKGKHFELEKNQQKEKNKEELGGLIFMCNKKTKPDCFRYHVMGVPISKKNLVLGIKPGLTLFLYDFDLRLMYGVYEASSSGGIKLEPTAFGGAFPIQVRFVVQKDCYPLAESVFKKAIWENYNEKNKFSVELTVKQVKKLTQLFRHVDVRSKEPATLPQPMGTIQNRHHPLLPRENGKHHSTYTEGPSTEKEEVSFLSEMEYRTYGLRAERPNPNLNLVPPASQIAPTPTLEPYPGEHHLRHPPALYRDTAPPLGEAIRGLRAERPNPNLIPTPPASHIAPTTTLEPYPREHHLRHPPALYRDTAPPPLGEAIRHDSLLPNEREYHQTYGLGTRQELQYSIPSVTASTLSSYPSSLHYPPSHYGASSVDPYPNRDEVPYYGYSVSGSRGTYPSVETDYLRRETYLKETTDHLSRRGSYLAEPDPLKRRESDGGERLYSSHASSALSDYNRDHNYPGARPEPSSLASVSARYSFAGPSVSYR